MLLGAHVSISGCISNAPARGEKIGCNVIQIFTKNQMQWQANDLSPDRITKFKSGLKQSSIYSVLAHDSYLINLGSPDPELLKKSRIAFRKEIERAEALGIPFLVFHPGAHTGAGAEHGLETIADSLNFLFDNYQSAKIKLLLENTAGQGSNLGYRFEQLAGIMGKVNNSERLGVCFDTAHAFAAGYDLRSEDSFQRTMNELDQIIGLDKLMAFHLNDSKKGLGSRVDRHEHIGKGTLGLQAFKFIINDMRFMHLPKVLETPGNEHDFKNNLDLLKSLIEQ